MRVANRTNLEHQLGLIEEIIMALEESDAFVEDLIRVHAERHALAATLSSSRDHVAARDPVATRRTVPPVY